MRIYKVQISDEALQEIESTANYIRVTVKNPILANRFRIKVFQTISSLSMNLNRFTILDAKYDSPKTDKLRKLIIDHYVAVYWVDEPSNSVHILAFYNQLQNY